MAQFTGNHKDKVDVVIFDKQANQGCKFCNRYLRAEGNYVSIAGINEAAVKSYSREQGSHDMALVKLREKVLKTFLRVASNNNPLSGAAASEKLLLLERNQD